MISVSEYYSPVIPGGFNTVRIGLGRLHVQGPGFVQSSGLRFGRLIQHEFTCFEVIFSDKKDGSTVSSIICDRW